MMASEKVGAHFVGKQPASKLAVLLVQYSAACIKADKSEAASDYNERNKIMHQIFDLFESLITD